MNLDETRIWSILQGHTGSQSAIRVGHLSQITGLTGRTIRMIVKDLIETHHKPIGSTVHRPYGYFVIVDNEERKAVRNSLMHRARSLLKRIQAYEPQNSQWASRTLGQLELELKEK